MTVDGAGENDAGGDGDDVDGDGDGDGGDDGGDGDCDDDCVYVSYGHRFCDDDGGSDDSTGDGDDADDSVANRTESHICLLLLYNMPVYTYSYTHILLLIPRADGYKK